MKGIRFFLFAILCFLCSDCITDETVSSAGPFSRGEDIWLKKYDFEPAYFAQPPQEFGPYTRWWWPGNDVTKEELKRELKLLAENGFAGVEIQPFTRGLNPNAKKDELERVNSWDTPEFYDNLKTVFEQARLSGITVDMNGGSGWPSGGPHVSQEDNILNLNFSAVTVKGGKKIILSVPPVSMEHRQVAMGGIGIKYADIDPALARLQAVTAARIVSENEEEPVHLDPGTATDISKFVKDNKIEWDAPEGNWKIIAFWSYPAGEIPVLIAKKDPGLVADHFDSSRVVANYEYLFGKRTGMDPFYGNPLRSVFNDSYEFKVDRHYSSDLIQIFKQKRGYDITPWLPANMQKGYNNHAESAYFPNQKPDFYFSDEDWRLQYDYDLTVGDLLQIHFFNPTRQWFESRGMLHRTQPYGLHMDVIAASGNSSIPESEQLYSGGSEGFLKLISSGAHLYNRPVVTSESVVYRYRAEMTTPQKIKISADKAFAAGVNQFIYHGTSYSYMTNDFSEAGWNAWDSPYTPHITYSSNIRETDNYWKDIKEINRYISRIQYALRAGKPRTDVLIYFPFLGVESRELMSNPEELLPMGHFVGVEPDSVIPAFGAPERDPAESTMWYRKIWGIVNSLESAGITWEFINDLSIQEAHLEQNLISVRGNEYQALILPHIPYIQKNSAEAITRLCKEGAKFLIVGEVPDKQPSFLNYRENDLITYRLLLEALEQKNSMHLDNERDFSQWTKQIKIMLNFNEPYTFIRQLDREMSDGSLLRFLWNKSDTWQEISFTGFGSARNVYWLDTEKGTVVHSDRNEISYRMAPYGSVILYVTDKKIPEDIISQSSGKESERKILETLTVWDINAGAAKRKNSSLFDWRSKDDFKFLSDDGVYTTSFTLKSRQDQVRYFLEMGKVYFTAEVELNGIPAGKRIYAPYDLDITDFIKEGTNQLTVRITPVQRNRSIGQALKGNPKYAQFNKLQNSLMPAGLLGPVILKAVDITDQ